MMIKQNLHTHSIYCDGQDTIDEMIEMAIAKKFAVLGFSSHGPNEPNDDYSLPTEFLASYIQDVHIAKQKYADKIKIYLGIEQDALGQRFDHSIFDYIIGSVHMVSDGKNYLPIDSSKQLTLRIIAEGYGGDFLAFTQSYLKEMEKLIHDPQIDIIGHFDLIQKFNEDQSMIAFADPAYLKMCYDALDLIIANDKIIEVNTGAIARGYRKSPYPDVNLLRYIAKKKGRICLNSDCHDRHYLDCYYDESLELIKECSFTHLMILHDDGFKKTAI